MIRRVLIWSTCLALLSFSVSGVHGHLALVGPHGAATPVHEHERLHEHADSHGLAVEIVSFAGADHYEVHEHHDDVDTDLLTTAFGKHPSLIPFAAALLLFCILPVTSSREVGRVRFAPPVRPPKSRAGPHFLPPSHAPPCAA
jgi:hypothetical protein